jgi:preprotein translocase subunit SecA
MTDKGIDLISKAVEDKNFFILPDIGTKIADLENSGLMEDKILEEKDKLISDYSIKSERVHAINQLLKAYAMFEKDVEYVLIENKVKIVDEQTGRIMEGRRYSDGLHQAIEAKENVTVEASTQTFATVTLQNYFRMYHKLAGMTGTAETEAKEFWDIYKLDVVVIPTNRKITRDDRNDLVYKTKREKYNAVIVEISELVKAGRPVLVGTTSVEISELLSRMLKIRKIEHNVLNAKLHQKEADIVAKAGQKGIVTIATNMAGRGTDIKLSREVVEAGGLAIIGTERHESRRIDRQLRGRAGRQGDPGSSQFYVSLEDDLMRMFGSDRIAKMMDRMGLDEGEVIQHSMISKSIERAQKKVEENNFGIRKRLLEYDDVMNSQREVVYKQRRHALYGERISVDLTNMIYDTSLSLVNENFGGDFGEFKMTLIKTLGIECPITEQEFSKGNQQKNTDLIFNRAIENYKRKKDVIVNQAFPVIKNVFETMSGQYTNIEVPITDGLRIYRIIVNLENAYNSKGKEVAESFEKQLILAIIDDSWKEHLREMDDLKQSVQNASYEQKDPLLIYKFESYELFQKMINENNKEIVTALMKASIFVQDSSQIRQGRVQKMDLSKYDTQKDEYSSNSNSPEKPQQKLQPIRSEKKVGRNEMVKVRYQNGNTLEGKFKKFENDIANGSAVLIE